MSVTANYVSTLTVTEVLGNIPLANPSESSIVHDQLNRTVSMSATTTVVASVVVAETFALTAGAATIDLTALTGTNSKTVDATGLKLQAIKAYNAVGNSAFTLKAGATNPYLAFGTAWSITLNADCEIMAYLAGTAPAVGGTAKTIDLAGTGTQAIKLMLVFG